MSNRTASREDQVTNGAKPLIDATQPYLVCATLRGVAPLLFHNWNTESVEEKANAPKNSKAKKTDNLESYVYRTEEGFLGIAGKCLHGAICEAAKRVADPCSPRKSARDLCKAGVQVLDIVAPFQGGITNWDYEDRQRVVIQRSAVTRTRPAMKSGWLITFRIAIAAPEYINADFIRDLIDRAGKFSGLCDFRPTYGRFVVDKFETSEF